MSALRHGSLEFRRINTNNGHGHAWPRPDGVKMRCGGPRLCKECATEAALVAEAVFVAAHPAPEQVASGREGERSPAWWAERAKREPDCIIGAGYVFTADDLLKAGNDLCFAAETSGGTAGPDEALQAAVKRWAAVRDGQSAQSPSVSPEQVAEASGREGAWLIERQVSTAPNWWSLKHKWTGDANKATRFSRQVDAEAFIDFHCLQPVAKATEHLWQDATPSAQADRAEAQDAAVGGLLSAAGVDDLCERLDDVLVEESPMHPFGCATWTEASHIAIDMAKDFIRQSGARAERAEAERDALRKALEPFSTVLADIGDDADDVDIYRAMTFQYRRAPAINVGHLRKARAALDMQGEGS